MLTDIRLRAQQLAAGRCGTPAELVRHFGAVQAQDVRAAKWAVGVRVPGATRHAVEDALARGEILRLHILRPTWHFVAAEDVRWLLAISGEKIKKANLGFARSRDPEVNEALCARCNALLERILPGRHLTRAELAEELLRRGLPGDAFRARRLLECAEADGVIVSGAEKDGEQTYALLEERVPAASPLTREKSLARLARLYFQSRSPAAPEDFAWWSDLSVSQARHAAELIRGELLQDAYDGRTLWVHETLARARAVRPRLHLLPPYDEYLIAYKNRGEVLPSVHAHRAHNSYGIFHPVTVWDGRVTGNWRAERKKGELTAKTDLFLSAPDIAPEEIRRAVRRYVRFWEN